VIFFAANAVATAAVAAGSVIEYNPNGPAPMVITPQVWRAATCHGCGAPHEPGESTCSYCKRPRN
jgi:hypothetical protein